jgi:hypothetical protein
MNPATHPVNLGARRIRRLAAHAVSSLAGITILLGISAAHASAATDCPQVKTAVLTTMSTSQSSCWKPFSSNSPVNAQLPTGPKLAADNAAVKQHMSAYGWNVQGSSNGFSLNGSDGTRPVYFASPSDPIMTINCKAVYGPTSCQGVNGISTDGARIHVPAGAKPTNNWDGHMTIVETQTGDEYDLWHAVISGSTITADTGAQENVNTSDGTGDGGDAASLALTAGLLRPAELASGHIDHALVMSIPCTNANGANVGYSWPASGGWGETCGQYWHEDPSSAPTIGQLFKLNLTDAQIAGSGAPAWQQTIMTALAHYGAYAEDTNGSWHNETMSIVMQDPASWTNLGQEDQWASTINALGGSNGSIQSSVPILPSQLSVVDPCVPKGTCPNDSTNNPDPTPPTTTPPTTTTPTATSDTTPPASPPSTTSPKTTSAPTTTGAKSTSPPAAPSKTTRPSSTKSTPVKTKSPTRGSSARHRHGQARVTRVRRGRHHKARKRHLGGHR